MARCCAHVQIVRVVIVRVIVDGVLGVIVVHIGHDEVLVIYVAIFVVIFCHWRCTLYTFHDEESQFHAVHQLSDGLHQNDEEELIVVVAGISCVHPNF